MLSLDIYFAGYVIVSAFVYIGVIAYIRCTDGGVNSEDRSDAFLRAMTWPFFLVGKGATWLGEWLGTKCEEYKDKRGKRRD